MGRITWAQKKWLNQVRRAHLFVVERHAAIHHRTIERIDHRSCGWDVPLVKSVEGLLGTGERRGREGGSEGGRGSRRGRGRGGKREGEGRGERWNHPNLCFPCYTLTQTHTNANTHTPAPTHTHSPQAQPYQPQQLPKHFPMA